MVPFLSTASKTHKKWWVQTLVSLLVSIAILGAIWEYFDLSQIANTLHKVSPLWLVSAFILFLLYQWLKGYRIRLLLNIEGSYKLFYTQCLHAFFNNLLPVGLGEGALVLLLRRVYKVNWYIGAASLVLCRLIDLALFVLLICLVFFFDPHFISRATGLVLVGLALLCFSILLSLFFFVRSPFEHIFESFFSHYLRPISQTLRQLRARLKISLFISSLAMWLIMYLFFVAVIAAIGYDIPLYNILWLYLLLLPVNLLPIKGLANFGSYEGAWFLSLRLLGVPEEDAATLGVSSHILLLAISILTGMLGLFGLGIKKN